MPSDEQTTGPSGGSSGPMAFRRGVVTGVALIALAIAMIWEAQGFPQIRSMSYGPDLFPKIIAGGLILSGLGIILGGLRDRLAIVPVDENPSGPFAVLPFLALVAIVAAFALLLPVLGFHVTAALALLCAVRVFDGGWGMAVIMAVIAPMVLHYVFYSLMRVVLPWGILEGVAW